jgi:hypothetical protein
MTSAITPAATRVLTDSELDTVAGGYDCSGYSLCPWSYAHAPPAPPPTNPIVKALQTIGDNPG